MTKQHHYNAFLKQISPSGTTSTGYTHHSLSISQSITIGSDRNCQIFLDSSRYPGVSYRHLEIRPLTSQPSGSTPLWQVCDLGSANGTYVNNQRLQGCRTLQIGDRISLGQHGPEFIFECQVSHTRPAVNPLNIQPSNSLRLSQVLPVISTRKDLRWRHLMVPGMITVLFVVLMFDAIQHPLRFMYLLGIFFAIVGYYVVYQLCGKSKPWWLIVAVVLTTILFNFTLFGVFAFFFRQVLPGNAFELMQQLEQGQPVNPIDFFVRMFFGAGLLEELTKALPVFALLFVGLKLKSPWRERIGVWEPLDGILLGTASAVGFTLQETFASFVFPRMQLITERAGEGAAVYYGLALLIPRIVGAIAAHMSYSGYFGYFIGLSVLKPRRRWQLLAIGYFTAATIHALWNSVDVFGPNAFIDNLLQAAAGILAFAFLIAAIFKARQLSPTRSQNWATQYSPTFQPQAPFSLRIQQRTIPLAMGTQLRAREIPGLAARKPGGVVAEVNVNPKDPSILGLQNFSHQVWVATLASGEQKQVASGRSIKLAIGTKINFGSVAGEIGQ